MRKSSLSKTQYIEDECSEFETDNVRIEADSIRVYKVDQYRGFGNQSILVEL